jgi:hypothetical protein
MKIEFTEVYGFRAALRGMRNPFDSWDNSDSCFSTRTAHHDWVDITGNATSDPDHSPIWCNPADAGSIISEPEFTVIGPIDLDLAKRLISKGGDHRKFMRMIIVWCDFVLPRYVWQEVDTYKVATVRNSCSTMNTLGKRDLQHSDFENPLPETMLQALNAAIADFREADGSKAKRSERVTMKDLLPEGFLQRATFMMSYEVCYRMFFARRNHRLPMWRETSQGSICSWIKSLPYMNEFLSVSM